MSLFWSKPPGGFPVFSPQPTRPLHAHDLIICSLFLTHLVPATQGLLTLNMSHPPPYFPDTHLVAFLYSFVFADAPISRDAFPSTVRKNRSTLPSPYVPCSPSLPTLFLSGGVHNPLAFFSSVWLLSFWPLLKSERHESRNS